jgi:nucleolar pre-ribosomal-associated protein 2
LELKRILPTIAEQLQGSQTSSSVGYLSSMIDTILHHKSFMVSQYGVDSVLAALTFITSVKRFENIHSVAPALYLKLCQILNRLLTLHRKHLGGRMHLLVPVLQRLLTCLFTLHPNSKAPPSLTPPGWLPAQQSTLSAPHANAYARLLTMWVQPSVASIGSSRSSRLTDETRRARQYATEYVPYVLMHYSSAQLVGRLTPEIRDAVLPGIWACIAAVSREGLRGMNASMGANERAIWANMWADWNRAHESQK